MHFLKNKKKQLFGSLALLFFVASSLLYMYERAPLDEAIAQDGSEIPILLEYQEVPNLATPTASYVYLEEISSPDSVDLTQLLYRFCHSYEEHCTDYLPWQGVSDPATPVQIGDLTPGQPTQVDVSMYTQELERLDTGLLFIVTSQEEFSFSLESTPDKSTPTGLSLYVQNDSISDVDSLEFIYCFNESICTDPLSWTIASDPNRIISSVKENGDISSLQPSTTYEASVSVLKNGVALPSTANPIILTTKDLALGLVETTNAKTTSSLSVSAENIDNLPNAFLSTLQYDITVCSSLASCTKKVSDATWAELNNSANPIVLTDLYPGGDYSIQLEAKKQGTILDISTTPLTTSTRDLLIELQSSPISSSTLLIKGKKSNAFNTDEELNLYTYQACTSTDQCAQPVDWTTFSTDGTRITGLPEGTQHALVLKIFLNETQVKTISGTPTSTPDAALSFVLEENTSIKKTNSIGVHITTEATEVDNALRFSICKNSNQCSTPAPWATVANANYIPFTDLVPSTEYTFTLVVTKENVTVLAVAQPLMATTKDISVTLQKVTVTEDSITVRGSSNNSSEELSLYTYQVCTTEACSLKKNWDTLSTQGTTLTGLDLDTLYDMSVVAYLGNTIVSRVENMPTLSVTTLKEGLPFTISKGSTFFSLNDGVVNTSVKSGFATNDYTYRLCHKLTIGSQIASEACLDTTDPIIGAKTTSDFHNITPATTAGQALNTELKKNSPSGSLLIWVEGKSSTANIFSPLSNEISSSLEELFLVLKMSAAFESLSNIQLSLTSPSTTISGGISLGVCFVPQTSTTKEATYNNECISSKRNALVYTAFGTKLSPTLLPNTTYELFPMFGSQGTFVEYAQAQELLQNQVLIIKTTDDSLTPPEYGTTYTGPTVTTPKAQLGLQIANISNEGVTVSITANAMTTKTITDNNYALRLCTAPTSGATTSNCPNAKVIANYPNTQEVLIESTIIPDPNTEYTIWAQILQATDTPMSATLMQGGVYPRITYSTSVVIHTLTPASRILEPNNATFTIRSIRQNDGTEVTGGLEFLVCLTASGQTNQEEAFTSCRNSTNAYRTTNTWKFTNLDELTSYTARLYTKGSTSPVATTTFNTTVAEVTHALLPENFTFLQKAIDFSAQNSENQALLQEVKSILTNVTNTIFSDTDVANIAKAISALGLQNSPITGTNFEQIAGWDVSKGTSYGSNNPGLIGAAVTQILAYPVEGDDGGIILSNENTPVETNTSLFPGDVYGAVVQMSSAEAHGGTVPVEVQMKATVGIHHETTTRIFQVTPGAAQQYLITMPPTELSSGNGRGKLTVSIKVLDGSSIYLRRTFFRRINLVKNSSFSQERQYAEGPASWVVPQNCDASKTTFNQERETLQLQRDGCMQQFIRLGTTANQSFVAATNVRRVEGSGILELTLEHTGREAQKTSRKVRIDTDTLPDSQWYTVYTDMLPISVADTNQGFPLSITARSIDGMVEIDHVQVALCGGSATVADICQKATHGNVLSNGNFEQIDTATLLPPGWNYAERCLSKFAQGEVKGDLIFTKTPQGTSHFMRMNAGFNSHFRPIPTSDETISIQGMCLGQGVYTDTNIGEEYIGVAEVRKVNNTDARFLLGLLHNPQADITHEIELVEESTIITSTSDFEQTGWNEVFTPIMKIRKQDKGSTETIKLDIELLEKDKSIDVRNVRLIHCGKSANADGIITEHPLCKQAREEHILENSSLFKILRTPNPQEWKPIGWNTSTTICSARLLIQVEGRNIYTTLLSGSEADDNDLGKSRCMYQNVHHTPMVSEKYVGIANIRPTLQDQKSISKGTLDIQMRHNPGYKVNGILKETSILSTTDLSRLPIGEWTQIYTPVLTITEQNRNDRGTMLGIRTILSDYATPIDIDDIRIVQCSKEPEICERAQQANILKNTHFNDLSSNLSEWTGGSCSGTASTEIEGRNTYIRLTATDTTTNGKCLEQQTTGDIRNNKKYVAVATVRKVDSPQGKIRLALRYNPGSNAREQNELSFTTLTSLPTGQWEDIFSPILTARQPARTDSGANIGVQITLENAADKLDIDAIRVVSCENNPAICLKAAQETNLLSNSYFVQPDITSQTTDSTTMGTWEGVASCHSTYGGTISVEGGSLDAFDSAGTVILEGGQQGSRTGMCLYQTAPLKDIGIKNGDEYIGIFKAKKIEGAPNLYFSFEQRRKGSSVDNVFTRIEADQLSEEATTYYTPIFTFSQLPTEADEIAVTTIGAFMKTDPNNAKIGIESIQFVNCAHHQTLCSSKRKEQNLLQRSSFHWIPDMLYTNTDTDTLIPWSSIEACAVAKGGKVKVEGESLYIKGGSKGLESGMCINQFIKNHKIGLIPGDELIAVMSARKVLGQDASFAFGTVHIGSNNEVISTAAGRVNDNGSNLSHEWNTFTSPILEVPDDISDNDSFGITINVLEDQGIVAFDDIKLYTCSHPIGAQLCAQAKASVSTSN